MSDAASPWWKPNFNNRGFLTSAGQAGTRRLLLIGVSGLALVALVVIVVTSGHHVQPLSQDTRMKPIDALPGGLHSTPEQDQLALQADTAHAQTALTNGSSYTPPLAPSATVVSQNPIQSPTPPPSAQPLPTPLFTPPPPAPVVKLDEPVFPPQTIAVPQSAPQPATVTPVATNPQQVTMYSQQINDLFSQWGGRAPETDVVMPPGTAAPSATTQNTSFPSGAGSAGSGEAADPPVNSASSEDPASKATVLVPAGRGIYAHPVLALNSDENSPVVMQADSGPIAGDRMIGTFERQNDRLVINISSIVHEGQTIPCDGLVIAPDTMEAAVATGVDEHYLSRVILPAAAAFVQGLGQAIATTSNSASVLSPLGGATTATNLNLRQQLGVGAGVAGAQVGSFLNQAAPKSPTVTLDANVGVGVMFLTDVKLPASN
jgi:intracellular multiplication protein IcmE